MSDPFQKLADWVRTVFLSPIGTNLIVDGPFGYIEADKMSVDLISPVSGKVINTNKPLMAMPSPINEDPYNTGWMLEIQLSKPDEMTKLVSPKYYVYLESLAAKAWTGPPPPMH
jgi:glycine cleavage system H protein